MASKLSYCGEQVQKHDPDRFLLSLFVPEDRREALWALFAFNHEIAKTREVVSETTLGQIRLQWWRDAIEGIYDGKVLEHEVVEPLAAVIQDYDLPREHFDNLIYAREFDLEGTAPAHLEGLLIYADHTTTPLLKLALQICGDDPETDVVQPVAINYALAGLIRAIPYHKSIGHDMMPADLIEGHEIPEVIERVLQETTKSLRPESKFLRVCDHFAQIHIKKIRNLGCDPGHARFPLPPAFLALRLVLKI